jgi:monoamine oxidase
MSISADLIIVGAGIAGLSTGIDVLKKYPNKRCIILEKYNYIGGRMVTYKKKLPRVGQVQWENGAGRIADSHKEIHALIKRYNLHTDPISSGSWFAPKEYDGEEEMSDNNFAELSGIYLDSIAALPLRVLQSTTLGKLLPEIFGPRIIEFILKFPYYSEIHTLRADLALKTFREEMGAVEGFSVCREGLSAIIESMISEFEKLGGVIHKNIELTEVISPALGKTNNIRLTCKLNNSGVDQRLCNVHYKAKACVLALHSEALRHIKGVQDFPVLKHLKMRELMRVYAVFPKIKGQKKVWFDGLEKVVTDGANRYIIPVNSEKGSIMISYTDGADVAYWRKKYGNNDENKMVAEMLDNLTELFPGVNIPVPIFTKVHYWSEGCTYWLPGSYDPISESKGALHPDPIKFPHLFMCGESFSMRQAWMEGAIEHAKQLQSLSTFHKALNHSE